METSENKSTNRLEFFPISIFSIILGLSGLTISVQKAEQFLWPWLSVSNYIFYMTALVFAALLVLYGVKVLKYLPAVRKEFHHPVKISFFPTVSISFLLFSVILVEQEAAIAFVLWTLGSILHLLLTLKIMTSWIHKTNYDIKHINPAWFIPAVGNIIVPLAGVRLASPEISWFFFSIGIILWIVLLTINIYRVIFHHPMPDKLMPTLFILIAPPAIGFLSLYKLTGETGDFSRILYFFALFLIMLLLFQSSRFFRLKFYLSWWAYSFPISAITTATLLMYKITGIQIYELLSYIQLTILCIMIIILVVKTIGAVARKGICLDED